MAQYRRQVVLGQIRPYPVVLCSLLILYRIAVYLWGLSVPLESAIPDVLAQRQPVARSCGLSGSDCVVRPELTSPDLIPLPPPLPPAGVGMASLRGIGGASLANIKIAVGFLDGVTIQPGEELSFDETARTWDFREDPRYFMSTATSARGIISMRGGGVCWLSTAIWNAALEAGLDTSYRQNHYGLVPILRPGLDATNTLVIRNDSDVPITLRAWMDGAAVHAELIPDRPLDRTAEIDGPYALGGGRYVVYQNIVWDDGSETQNKFSSYYYW
jgi:hypothetical protein